MNPEVFRRRFFGNDINPLFATSFSQQRLDCHIGCQSDPMGILVPIFFHEAFSKNQYRPWVPRLPFSCLDRIKSSPTTVGKFTNCFILASAPDNPTDAAMPKFYRQFCIGLGEEDFMILVLKPPHMEESIVRWICDWQ